MFSIGTLGYTQFRLVLDQTKFTPEQQILSPARQNNHLVSKTSQTKNSSSANLPNKHNDDDVEWESGTVNSSSFFNLMTHSDFLKKTVSPEKFSVGDTALQKQATWRRNIRQKQTEVVGFRSHPWTAHILSWKFEYNEI